MLVLPLVLSTALLQIYVFIGLYSIVVAGLSLLMGFAGQVSLGQAAFMALGGYAAGIGTYYGSMLLWGTTARDGTFLGAGEWLFVGGCLIGGIVGMLAGYVVGLPSLRLRGDYLAIVTLG